MKKTVLLNDVVKITPSIHKDERGYFSEDYNKRDFKEVGIADDFVQDNISYSEYKNTIRGMHFQINSYAQSKLIKVIQGSILDIFIDIRKKSSSYETFGSYELRSNDGWIYIPKGFAHGFCTLEDSTIVSYKVDEFFNKESDYGISWNDPLFNIKWPFSDTSPIISEKDNSLPSWRDISSKVSFGQSHE